LTDGEKLPHPRLLSEREGCLCTGRLTDGEKLPRPIPPLAILMMVFSLINRKKTIEIPTYELPIILYYSNHNKASVIGFADTLIQASNQFLYNKYSKVDRMLPIEPQLNSLQFLRNREVISEEEYDTLKDQLLGKEIKNGIGFSRLL
jgi:hypothetical protein